MSHRRFLNFRRPPPGVTACLLKPIPWRPMTDEEWEGVMHFMVHVHPSRGRLTILGARRSLDACFHAACMDRPWRDLPGHYGQWASIARLFRRWTHAGLWKVMLRYFAKRRPGLAAIRYWVCRAFRRAWRIQGLAGLTLARKLGMDSALRALSWSLPDSNLSHYYENTLWPRIQAEARSGPGWLQRFWIDFLIRLHNQCRGWASLPPHFRLTWLETHCPELFPAVVPRSA